MRFDTLRCALVGTLLSFVSVTSGCDKKDAPTPPAAEGATAEAGKTPEEKPREKAAVKATGITMKLTVNGAESTLVLNDAILAARAEDAGPGIFSCTGAIRRVTLSDFSIGDDPAKKGELFSAGAEPTVSSSLSPT